MEALSTPPQPHPSPTPFGDFRTNTYRYDPALSAVLHLPPQASAVPMTKTSSGGEGAGWQAGLLLVLRRDGVVHAVCLHSALTVAPFIRDLGESLGLSVASESALAAGLVMGIMIIPFVMSLSDDIINAVPDSLREASLGMGATMNETIRKVIFPGAQCRQYLIFHILARCITFR